MYLIMYNMAACLYLSKLPVLNKVNEVWTKLKQTLWVLIHIMNHYRKIKQNDKQNLGKL